MIRSIGSRLRLVLRQPGSADDAEPSERADGRDGPELDFVAYTATERLSGRIRLDAARLSDMLDAHDDLLLACVLAERLPAGGSLVVADFPVRRRELFLVHAAGPRGDRSKRTRTKAHRLAMQVGPYLVTGSLHAVPGLDPLVSIRWRGPMLPLTDACIEIRVDGRTVREPAGTVVVNRDHVDWVRLASAAAGPASVVPERLSVPGRQDDGPDQAPRLDS